ncbi:hypothetical protein GF386_02815 [Candidatus Pacearchaeota archaeon]|nr:hypothetical protein [Candidatus Pacearchaeota archaeon]MBD3283080.1 hypothetical protein [Candidatus Pacearchaeota archaeon]
MAYTWDCEGYGNDRIIGIEDPDRRDEGYPLVMDFGQERGIKNSGY